MASDKQKLREFAFNRRVLWETLEEALQGERTQRRWKPDPEEGMKRAGKGKDESLFFSFSISFKFKKSL